ncbi:MAG: LysM peptidoglycan-binding domain-containing protein [Clostridiales bacterium]|nr:LysM peptidoglycan-binding domain-containing protein [Clostridiales bacterium]
MQNKKFILNDKNIIILGSAIVCLFILISAGLISTTVTAEKEKERYKRVTTVEIKKGDTLWSIASDYITDEYRDINDYIKEIKDSNGLDSDTIHAGNYIIVPYYSDLAYDDFNYSDHDYNDLSCTNIEKNNNHSIP